jgi:hypothetical protein
VRCEGRRHMISIRPRDAPLSVNAVQPCRSMTYRRIDGMVALSWFGTVFCRGGGCGGASF